MASGPIVAVVAWKPLPSNLPLVDAWRRVRIRAELRRPPDARSRLGAGDIALVRLDVIPALDGIEAGLLEVAALERRGVRLLNRAAAPIAAHDKRQTAVRLTDAGIPHPRSVHRKCLDEVGALDPPFVLKRRFGSWGRDVMLCRDAAGLERCLAKICDRRWSRCHGVLIQEVVPSLGYDLRVIVAGERVVGAERREASPREWRTNNTLGGRVMHVEPPAEARALAVGAARAIGADLLGVDLLPQPGGGYVVVELNSAVDFDAQASFSDRGVYLDVADALGLRHVGRSTAESSRWRARARTHA